MDLACFFRYMNGCESLFVMLLLYGKNFIFSSFYFTCFLLEKKEETTVFKNVYMLKFFGESLFLECIKN
ncbi:hypothetical protein CON48_16605 [Bacillus thuringiensis]|uniref:Uncharacterized protein n=1 Tax=Bacillus thuringiensis TaxID=1428 RepID=A0A9X6Z2L0_BACTU|nr:hypothetical protein DT426_22995 [Bacillus cereus]KAA0829068.1 hypothetical protein DN403_07280 [Bacillus sp. AY2-1]OTY28265.1 hypothetical protein BK736_29075 [Bacillus thuringiensis serovar poloniensis]OTZ27414.1 hypothetical protein BK763_26660 [Bacillus thuringiensis serovar thompsoni]PEA49279.1 hypothetical protein CON48_16605 [Bacillus thuringiensis]